MESYADLIMRKKACYARLSKNPEIAKTLALYARITGNSDIFAKLPNDLPPLVANEGAELSRKFYDLARGTHEYAELLEISKLLPQAAAQVANDFKKPIIRQQGVSTSSEGKNSAFGESVSSFDNSDRIQGMIIEDDDPFADDVETNASQPTEVNGFIAEDDDDFFDSPKQHDTKEEQSEPVADEFPVPSRPAAKREPGRPINEVLSEKFNPLPEQKWEPINVPGKNTEQEEEEELPDFDVSSPVGNVNGVDYAREMSEDLVRAKASSGFGMSLENEEDTEESWNGSLKNIINETGKDDRMEAASDPESFVGEISGNPVVPEQEPVIEDNNDPFMSGKESVEPENGDLPEACNNNDNDAENYDNIIGSEKDNTRAAESNDSISDMMSGLDFSDIHEKFSSSGPTTEEEKTDDISAPENGRDAFPAPDAEPGPVGDIQNGKESGIEEPEPEEEDQHDENPIVNDEASLRYAEAIKRKQEEERKQRERESGQQQKFVNGKAVRDNAPEEREESSFGDDMRIYKGQKVTVAEYDRLIREEQKAAESIEHDDSENFDPSQDFASDKFPDEPENVVEPPDEPETEPSWMQKDEDEDGFVQSPVFDPQEEAPVSENQNRARDLSRKVHNAGDPFAGRQRSGENEESGVDNESADNDSDDFLNEALDNCTVAKDVDEFSSIFGEEPESGGKKKASVKQEGEKKKGGFSFKKLFGK